jgi:hypothetical protein
MKKSFFVSLLSILSLDIRVAYAQGGGAGGTTFKNLVEDFFSIIQSFLPVVAALALLAFFLGLVRFIMNVSGGDAKAVTEGQNLMKWGLLALFLMVSVWGILRFFHAELGFTNFGLPFLPTR